MCVYLEWKKAAVTGKYYAWRMGVWIRVALL